MEGRSSIGRRADKLAGVIAILFVLMVYFSLRMRNVLWGAALALPVTALLVYAYVLWQRRRSDGNAASQAARWQLRNLMLDPPDAALLRIGKLIAQRYGLQSLQRVGSCLYAQLDGKRVVLSLLQLPPDKKADSEEVLRFYQSAGTAYAILISTAPFTDSAAAFARQMRNPSIALLGPEELLPLLKKLPTPPDAPKMAQRVHRQATFRELMARMREHSRVKRYLLYGTLMLGVYIVFDQIPFLIPGLLCIFLAVIAGRQSPKDKRLFEEDTQA